MTSTITESTDAKIRWSSGVPFKPHPKYWRIGNKYYDLTPFLDKHPGGRQLLELARDRFEDATYAFEAHHHNQKKVRGILSKYEVKDLKVPQDTLHKYPNLTKEDDFYFVLRERVSAYLKTVGGPGPTQQCLVLWWVTVATWITIWSLLYITGDYKAALALGWIKAVVGGFGHNWVHQYQYRNWAYLGLDLLGLSSEGWIREHLLQHHMYTNTPLDNHWDGTSPFLVVDQTCERNFVSKYITPYLSPVLLFFGISANFIAHTTELLAGNEDLSFGKLFLPLQFALLYNKWGFHGIFMLLLSIGFASVYYFTIALMNHNTEHTWDVDKKNNSRDWGEAQLNSSADIETQLTFYESARYLWLNYHTVHHLFPHTDMSKHPGIQKVLIETCKEFKIKYESGTFMQMYKEMMISFSSPRHLGKEVKPYYV